jgi:hypothetical protein
MTKRDALKLHNGDEVIRKQTGESYLVNGDPWIEEKYVFFAAVHRETNVWRVFDHKEVR